MATLGTCLWFDGQAEEAAAFYVSVFKGSWILDTTLSPEGSHLPAGSVLAVRFILDGREYMALNGGPGVPFTPALSLVATCDTQEEVDDLWAKLSDGGAEVQCGWLTDRYGVSWQVVPRGLVEMLGGPDPAASRRAFQAMECMVKLDLAALRRACEGPSPE